MTIVSRKRSAAVMILRTLAFTIATPGLVCVLIPYLLVSASRDSAIKGPAVVLVTALIGGRLVRLLRLTRDRAFAAPLTRDPGSVALVLTILGEAAAFRSLTLLLYSPVILLGLISRRLSAAPGATSQERAKSVGGRAGIAVLLLGVVPYLLLRAEPLAAGLGRWRLLGLVPIGLGACTYAWCAWNFTFSGRGTPGSTRPTAKLVAVGLYRFSRNPMYVGIVSILLGEAILFRSVTLLVYALLMLQRFRFNVVHCEEPALRERFGAAYEEYLRSVPRWLPGVAGLGPRPTAEKEPRETELARKQPVTRTKEELAQQCVNQAIEEIAVLIPLGEQFILVDQDKWGTDELVAGRRRIPFLEREGQYWGPPEDDETAIRELERLRQAGAGFMVFGWPAFWWLEHYAGLQRHLRSRFRCVLENGRLVVFDLRA
jgi:protein-S-isoprenylcysteine O-methyltransferase Ste14